MKKLRYDLQETRKYVLVGETIAYHYLLDNYFWRVERIGFAKDEVILIPFGVRSKNPLFIRKVKEPKKREYLLKAPRWDFFAYKRDEEWLVEVKTLRERRRPHRTRPSGDIEEAKNAGFRTLLLIVSLLENWRCEVEPFSL